MIKKLTLFPTFIWLCYLKLDNDYKQELLDDIYKRKSEGKDFKRSNDGGWQSENHLYQYKLYHKALDECTKIIQNVFRGPFICDFRQLWAQINKKGDYNRLHGHGGIYDLTGSLYLKAPKGSGSIYFRDPRPGAMLTPSVPFNWSWEEKFPVEEDLLILSFPFLEHGTWPGTNAEDRVSLHWDMSFVMKQKDQPGGYE
tara:strand:- start:212 stop:805 length:594 start_codon:yes stop_codon:yes gene_type:complete